MRAVRRYTKMTGIYGKSKKGYSRITESQRIFETTMIID
jgi:hypothetical protein